MVILVTGAGGQLGTHLSLLAPQSHHNYILTDIDTLDITSAQAVREAVDRYAVDCIINCAAYTNVDKAEDDQSAATLLNATAPGILADAMKARGGWLIHVSTDYVFGGSTGNTPRDEKQPPNPTGAYGRTKLLGEQAVTASGCNNLIIRTAWLYSEYGRNFLKTMLTLTAEKPTLNVVCDQVGSPTYAGDLAAAIFQITEENAYLGHQGIYHYTNHGVCSWYDFAHAIARLSGHDKCRILPCASSQYPSKVIRPPYSVLDKTKIISTFHLDIPHWYDSLQKCLSNITFRNQ